MVHIADLDFVESFRSYDKCNTEDVKESTCILFCSCCQLVLCSITDDEVGNQAMMMTGIFNHYQRDQGQWGSRGRRGSQNDGWSMDIRWEGRGGRGSRNDSRHNSTDWD